MMAALFKSLLQTKLSCHNVAVAHVRYLNLLEYQSKTLLQSSGVAIQTFRIVENIDEAKRVSQNFKVAEYVIKAQVLAGGRGLGHFDNGFKSGVHLTKDPSKVAEIVEKMLDHRLITKQTPKEGILVKKVMVAESVNIMRETYICILMDRGSNGPVIIASSVGGTDIENVAEKTPHLIKTIPVDILIGVTDSMAESVADFLQFKGNLKSKAAEEIKKMWKLFKNVDALQMEINPFVETDKGDVISMDAKFQFDDNAQFRQVDIFSLEDVSETDPREVEAAKAKLNYISMSGNIGCLDPNVKAILVNVFGGIVNCATIANGIINASLNLKLNIPLIVRLEGTNVNEAKKILSTSGLDIVSASNLEDAAQKAVSCLK